MLALQSMVTRRFDAFDPVVLTVGSFHAGTVDNVIPDRAEFAATVRSFSPAAREAVLEQAVRVVRGIGEAHGCRVDAAVEPGYPVTVNDPGEAAYAALTARRLFGAGRYLELPRPLAGSEDFGLLAAYVPAAYLVFGACPPGADPAAAPYNHSAQARFDDAVLGDAAALLAALALGADGRLNSRSHSARAAPPSIRIDSPLMYAAPHPGRRDRSAQSPSRRGRPSSSVRPSGPGPVKSGGV